MIPKCSFFLWLAFRNRHPTRDRLLNYGIILNDSCVLCNGMNTESIAHLLTNCPFIKPIFDSVGIQFTCDWNFYLQGHFFYGQLNKIQQQVAYLYLAVAGHTIWKERNFRIHNLGKEHSAQQLLYIIKQTVREKLFTSKRFHKAATRDISLISNLY